MELLEPLQRQRLQGPGDFQFQQMGCRTRRGIRAQQRVRQDRKVLDCDGFEAEIERAGLPRGIDARLDQPHELVEDRVLQGNRQRKYPIEPPLDRRQVIDHGAVRRFDPQARQLLKAPEADRFELAGKQQAKPAMERFLGVDAFEIVSRIEQVLSACLALPACQRPETVERRAIVEMKRRSPRTSVSPA